MGQVELYQSMSRVLDEHGWMQGELYDQETETLCLLGSYNWCKYGKPPKRGFLEQLLGVVWTLDELEEEQQKDDLLPLVRMIETEFPERKHLAVEGDFLGIITDFNDDTATTLEDVKYVLEKTIANV